MWANINIYMHMVPLVNVCIYNIFRGHMNIEVVTLRKGYTSLNSFVSYFNIFFLTSVLGCRLFILANVLEYD